MKSASVHRRSFLTLLGGAAAAWPLAARAQQRPGISTIGVLIAVSMRQWEGRIAEFRRGLGEAGFVEGRNVKIEYRYADGQFDRLSGLALDLVDRQVSVIFAGGSNVGTLAAMAATKSIPIVFATGADPVIAGFVASLGRPGGNVTGISTIGDELGAKRLELLHEILPTVRRIAVLVNPSNPLIMQGDIEGAEEAARRLGLEIVLVKASTVAEIETAFATAIQQRASALTFGAEGFLNSRREQIAALALRHALPTMSAFRETALAGVLMSYGASPQEQYRQAGIYVGRILKGEKPSDLPVMQPTRFELVVNLNTAKAIGLPIPEAFLLRADEVIE